MNGRATASLPAGFTSITTSDGVALVVEGTTERKGPRIELAALPKADYGVERTVALVLDNIQQQAAAMPESLLGPVTMVSVNGGTVPAGFVDWSYASPTAPSTTTRTSRRHWVLSLKRSVVQISCIDLPAVKEACAAVVNSISETTDGD